jgi:hypothetical protein
MQPVRGARVNGTHAYLGRYGAENGGQALVKIDYELSDRYCKGDRIICEPQRRLAQ